MEYQNIEFLVKSCNSRFYELFQARKTYLAILPKKNASLRYSCSIGGCARSMGNSCSIKTIWYSSTSVSQPGLPDSFALRGHSRGSAPCN